MADDPDIDGALLIADLLEELDEQRSITTELATDLDAVRLLLSEALSLIQRQTTRIARQADQIRQLMGLLQTGAGWHPPIRLADTPDMVIPEGMVRVNELRWTLNDGK